MTETKESKFYYVVLFFILILGFFLRAYLMDLRPLHADEGVNFMFMNDIIKRGHYQYNPENYHGPTLYYLTLLPFYYFCLDTSPMPEEVLPTPETVYRLCPMLLGFGVVLILIPLKKWLGKAGLLTAMAFAAISPTAVYYSRDNIHEMYLMFFTAAAFVMGYLYFTTQKNKFMYLTAAFIALMFATKETTMVTVVVWCLSAIGASIFTTDPIFDLAKRFKESIKGAFGIYKKPVFICFFLITILTLCLMLFASNNFKKVELKWYIALLTKGIAMVTLLTGFLMLFRNLQSKFYRVLLAWLVFFAVMAIFFTSFFSHADGLGKFFKAFEMWTHQGTTGSQHTKAFGYYLKILFRFERYILILGILGAVLAFWKRKPIDLFTAFFAIGTFFAFSFIPYKTPWCVQNIILPLILLSGLFVKYLFELTPYFILKCAYVPIILVILFMTLTVSADTNYYNFDNDSYDIVYVQTNRSNTELVKRVIELSNVKYEGKDTKINVDLDGTLPLNWYFRNLKLSWFNQVNDNLKNYPIIIGNKKKEKELDSLLLSTYKKEGYPFNPATGNFLALYYQDMDFIKKPEEKLDLKETVNFKGEESKLKPGLLGTVYQNIFFKGRKIAKQVDTKIDFWYNSDLEKPYPAPFSIVWEGYVKIPKSGNYIFSTSSDDGSYIYLDNKLVVDNGGEHGADRRENNAYLSKGYHKIEIKYYDISGGAVMQLKWKQPEQAVEDYLTSEYLFHDE